MVIDYLPENCKRKFKCPGCEPGQLCPPWYELTMNGLDRHWDVSVVEGSGKRVATKIRRKNGELRIAFRPDKNSYSPGEIGDYHLVFRSARGSPVAKANRIKMSIKRLNREPK